EHRDLLAVQNKIAATRDYLATIPVAPPQPPRMESAPAWPSTNQVDWTTAKPSNLGSGFERASSSSKQPSSNEVLQTGFSSPTQTKAKEPIPFTVPSSVKLLESPGASQSNLEPKSAAQSTSAHAVESETKIASLSSLDKSIS